MTRGVRAWVCTAGARHGATRGVLPTLPAHDAARASADGSLKRWKVILPEVRLGYDGVKRQPGRLPIHLDSSERGWGGATPERQREGRVQSR